MTTIDPAIRLRGGASSCRQLVLNTDDCCCVRSEQRILGCPESAQRASGRSSPARKGIRRMNSFQSLMKVTRKYAALARKSLRMGRG